MLKRKQTFEKSLIKDCHADAGSRRTQKIVFYSRHTPKIATSILD